MKASLHRFANATRAATDHILRSRKFCAKNKPKNFSSGTRLFEGSQNRRLQFKTRLVQRRQVVLRPIEISQCGQLRIGNSKLFDRYPPCSNPIKQERRSKLVWSQQL